MAKTKVILTPDVHDHFVTAANSYNVKILETKDMGDDKIVLMSFRDPSVLVTVGILAGKLSKQTSIPFPAQRDSKKQLKPKN